jgi:putative DNA methylase
MSRFADLFTDRQLVALTTFSDLVGEAREKVYADAVVAGLPDDESPTDRLEAGGTGAAAYADAVSTYLGLAVDRLSSTNSALCRWNSATSKESVSDTFARQALPMIWDFAEGNTFTSGPCELAWSVAWVARVLDELPAITTSDVEQADASHRPFDHLISTDPPYYDNVPYAALSDFFYVWLRRSLLSIHPGLLSTVLVPKADELVADPSRLGGKDAARNFFEDGFTGVCFHRLPDHGLLCVQAVGDVERRAGLDRMGDAAGRLDQVRLDGHRNLADAERAHRPDARDRVQRAGILDRSGSAAAA